MGAYQACPCGKPTDRRARGPVKAPRPASEKQESAWRRRLACPFRSPGDVLINRVLVGAAAVVALLAAAPMNAQAAFTPNGTEYHPLTFPVRETVHYYDDFGGVLQHP